MNESRDIAAARYAGIAETLEARGIAVSDWQVAESSDTHAAPLWVRSTSGFGNACCQVVDDLHDFPLAAIRIRKAQPESSLLLQPALVGPTYRAVGFKWGHRFVLAALLRESMVSEHVRVPMVLQMPTGQTDRDRATLLALATAAGDALPKAEAPAEVEIVWTAQGPVVTDARLTSGVDPWNVQLVRLATGIDLERLNETLRQGQEPCLSPRRAMAVLIHWLPARTGLVHQVEGVDAARAIPGVETVHLQAAPGDTLRHVVDTSTRRQTGYLIVMGATLAHARKSAAAALAQITITASKMTGPPSA